MGNEIEKKPVFGGNVAMTNSQVLLQQLEQSAQKDPRGASADGSDYMNFSGKRGVYEIGKDKNDADPNELWLVAVNSFQDGYVCWKGGRAVATRLAPMGTPVPAPDESEHGPFTKDGDGWFQAKAMTAKSIDSGQQVYFKINSTSGVSEFANLQKMVVQRLRAGLACWPVVSFTKEKFQAQGYTNHKPIIKVDGWLSQEAIEKLVADLDDENAEIDMEALYEMSNAPAEGIEDKREEQAPEQQAEAPSEQKVARRNKRL